uniref:Major facilitator superfamily (MFS) profile domain-containing protein n=1 Tax=Clastoptera arizonana TaxID=38151 RepID=A0A1B6C167_9HEMI
MTINKKPDVPPGMKLVAPDGGWGWFVVLGSSLVNLSTRSIEPSFGLLFGDLLKDLNVETTGAAIIMSTLDAMINFSGLFVGPLIKKFSFRKVGLLGAFLSSIAMFLTSGANSMLYIICTYSVIGGLGFGLATASTLVALNSYFNFRRGQAVGLAMTGTALGFMAMPQVIRLLMEEYDFRGTLIILSATSLNAAVGASLLQPVKWHMKLTPVKPQVKAKEEIPVQDLNTLQEEDEKEEDDNELSKSLLGLPRNSSTVNCNALNRQVSMNASERFGSSTNFGRKISVKMPRNTSVVSMVPARKRKTSIISNVSNVDLMGSTMHIHIDSDSEEDENPVKIEDIKTIYKTEQSNGEIKENNKRTPSIKKKKEEQGCWGKFSNFMDLDLLKDPIFLNILVGLSFAYVAELNYKMVVPFFMANLGYTKKETALALSLMAISDIAARVIMPPIFDRLPYTRRATFAVGCFFLATARSVLAEQTEWYRLISALIVHGFFRGVTFINFFLVISEYAPLDKFAPALGLSMVTRGLFICALGPLNGWIRDYTGSYQICIHMQSAMILTCVLAWSIEYLLRQRVATKQLAGEELT